MSILRKAQCDICGKEEFEKAHGEGWKDWVIINGVVLDGVSNPMVCPECRDPIMNFIDKFKQNIIIIPDKRIIT